MLKSDSGGRSRDDYDELAIRAGFKSDFASWVACSCKHPRSHRANMHELGG